MRLPVWKRKTMLAQAIAQKSTEQVQESLRRDIFVRLMEQHESSLPRLASGYAQQSADREDLFQEIAVSWFLLFPSCL